MGCKQSTPVQEHEDVAPASNQVEEHQEQPKSQAEEAKVEAEEEPQQEVAETAEPETETTEEEPKSVHEPEADASASEQPEEETPEAATESANYNVSGAHVGDGGVVFYKIESTDESVKTEKRFSDFKKLYADLKNTSTLPPLPRSGFGTVMQKHNDKLMKDREAQFAKILNAISNNSELAESEAFKKFIQ